MAAYGKVYSGSLDNTVKVWSSLFDNNIAILDGQTCAPIGDGNICAGDKECVYVWDGKTHKLLARLKADMAMLPSVVSVGNVIYVAGLFGGKMGACPESLFRRFTPQELEEARVLLALQKSEGKQEELSNDQKIDLIKEIKGIGSSSKKK